MNELILSYGYTNADNYDCYCVINHPGAIVKNLAKTRNEKPVWIWAHSKPNFSELEELGEKIKDKNPAYYKKVKKQYEELQKCYELEQSLGDITQYKLIIEKWPVELEQTYWTLKRMYLDLKFYKKCPAAARRYLYLLSETDHIIEMRRLLDQVPVKPDWATEIGYF